MPEEPQVLQNAYLPPEAVQSGFEYLEWVKAHAGRAFELPIPGIGNYCPAVMPGHIAGVLGQTHSGKTLLLDAIAVHNANKLNQRNPKALVVKVSLEENLQDLMLKEFARVAKVPIEKLAVGDVDLKALKVHPGIAGLYGIPIARLAQTMLKSKVRRGSSLFLSQVEKELRVLQSQGWEIGGLIVDYLTALPLDPAIKKNYSLGYEGQRRLQVREDVYKLREMGNDFGVPVFVGLQAKQDLHHNPASGIHLPGIYDVKESSDVSEHLDRLYSIWLPKVQYPGRRTFKYNGNTITADDNLMFFWVCKQKGGLKSGRIYVLRWNYDTLTVGQDADLNP